MFCDADTDTYVMEQVAGPSESSISMREAMATAHGVTGAQLTVTVCARGLHRLSEMCCLRQVAQCPRRQARPAKSKGCRRRQGRNVCAAAGGNDGRRAGVC
eukprot:COSAG01_NODE_624_length_14732_cov_58.900772_6_plen_101_part_00